VTGGQVKRLRERLGLTRAQLAARLGTLAATIAKWETGVWTVRAASARQMTLLARTQRKRK